MFYELKVTLARPNSEFDEVIGIAIGSDDAEAIQASEDKQSYMASLFKKYYGTEIGLAEAYIKKCELKELHLKTRGV